MYPQNVKDAEKRWNVAKSRFGEGHPHEMSCAQGVAMALNNLALALKGRGDIHGAEPLLRRALEVMPTRIRDENYQRVVSLRKVWYGVGQDEE